MKIALSAISVNSYQNIIFKKKSHSNLRKAGNKVLHQSFPTSTNKQTPQLFIMQSKLKKETCSMSLHLQLKLFLPVPSNWNFEDPCLTQITKYILTLSNFRS